MRIYISGKITGLLIEEAQANFAAAAQLIRDHGHESVNPMELVPFNKDWGWIDYMRADIKILMGCDGIFMLDNWKDSEGAIVEATLMQSLKLPIFNKNTLFIKSLLL